MPNDGMLEDFNLDNLFPSFSTQLLGAPTTSEGPGGSGAAGGGGPQVRLCWPYFIGVAFLERTFPRSTTASAGGGTSTAAELPLRHDAPLRSAALRCAVQVSDELFVVPMPEADTPRHSRDGRGLLLAPEDGPMQLNLEGLERFDLNMM